jgi:hypothetical protein
MLRFDVGRRLLVALLLMLVMILASVAGTHLGALWGMPPWGVGAAALILLAVPVLLLDAATLA